MKPLIYLTAAAAALSFAASGNAGTHHRHMARWHHMTLKQKRVIVVKTVNKEHTTLQWWLHNKPRFPEASVPWHHCAAVNARMPGEICFHAQRLVEARHVLVRIDAKLDAAALAASLRAAFGDFQTAAHFADRIWPGTYQWLIDCSSSEGGHGRFVMNHGGSGAGGWMQFMSGTFYGNVDGAFREARRLGVAVPTAARSWQSPLGQAITAAWMRHHHYDSGQWTGASC